ncbi:sodium:solute symporter family transporter [Paenibacillus sp. sgz302251]|uniref:sodium:solute symporter family transporter n=1 Tax=Paenibacillus sp. sgz302251 TaxID=3414493 RepID=UPI003C7A1411
MLNSWIGYAIMLAFGVIMVIVSILSTRNSKKNIDDFFSARESMSLPMAMGSLVVVWVWSSSLMGAAEGAYNFGVAGFYMYGISVLISALLLGRPIFKRVRKLAPLISTMPEFMKARIGKQTHIVFTIVGILQSFFWAVLQMTAIGLVMNVLFGIPHAASVMLGAIIVITYVTIGGLRASIGTDVVHFTMLLVLLAIVIPVCLWVAGGPREIYQGLVNSSVDTATLLWTKESITGWLLVSVLSFINYAIIDQSVWQRVYATKKGNESKLVLGTTFAWLPIPAVAGLMGMVGLAQGLDVNPSEIFPAVVGELLGTWGIYAMAIIMIATILSTTDSCLNALSTLIVKDIYIPYFKKNAPMTSNQEMKIARFVVIISGLAIALFSLAQFSILYLNYAVGALTLAMTWPFVLSVFMKKLNKNAAYWGLVIGTISGLFFAVIPGAGLMEPIVPLWVGYLISHAIAAGIPLIGTLIKPDHEFQFEKAFKQEAI